MNRPVAYYRARTGSDDPLFSGEGSQASQAKEQPQEAENRMKAAGDLRDLRDHGHICTLPPENRGRGGVLPRVGKKGSVYGGGADV